MTAQPVPMIGSLLITAAGLLFASVGSPPSRYWIGEVDGSSMTPTLFGRRQVFRCLECGKPCEFEIAELADVPVFRCTSCNTWQRAREPIARIPADRVVLIASIGDRDLAPGAVVAIDHPIFGLTAKRIASVCASGYEVIGDNPVLSLDSRNPRFGPVARNQIRGIVVKILPARPLAPVKRSR